jgi:hypothetical protein
VVRPAGIEPAILSLEVRSSRTTDRTFKTFGVLSAKKWLLSTPPAHYSFTLADLYASLAGGQRETLDQQAPKLTRSREDLIRNISTATTAASTPRTIPANLSTLPSGQAVGGIDNCLICGSNVDRLRGVVFAPPLIGQNLSPVTE